ncbi:tRNA 4-thiouridine(8) synthase ThiI [Ruminococcaceae bacterium OttesenSCG-928-I18]|nr:tRNA 4-thiouridine(8) synthase ThiI [Ruminococcaceae bacterium OttesenSCG-928-I18]
MREMLMATMGEMTLKGQNRKSFENALLKNLRVRLQALGEWKLHAAQSTVYIEPCDERAVANTTEAFERCLRVFGIAAFSRAAICEKDFESITKTAVDYLAPQLLAAKTFKVAAKRADKSFPLNSMELSRELGGELLLAFPHLKVDVHTPELTVMTEIRETAAYVHAGKQKGPGGLPIPTSGRAAVLLSGGIDSPVAAYQMAKRGLGLVAVHFASPPYTSPRAAAKVQTLARLLSGYTGPLPYYVVEYTKAQEYLRDQLPKQEYFTVLMRRSMLRIAHRIARREECLALITGESLAQVASQTLQALAATDEAQSLPVLRPCIGMDKAEITDVARRIGTFETSILPYEDCCTIFTPPHPRTKPKLEDVLRLEQALPELEALEAQATEEAVFTLVREDG